MKRSHLKKLGGVSVLLSISFLVLISVFTFGAPGDPGYDESFSNYNSNAGTNLAATAFLNTNRPFLDQMHQTSLIPVTTSPEFVWNDYSYNNWDANGWPTQLGDNQEIHSIILAANPTAPIQNMVGDFVVLYEGEGTLNYAGNIANVDRSAGRDVVTTNGLEFTLIISITTNGNHLRNIRVIPPGGICDGDIFTHYDNPSSCSGTFESYETANLIFHPEFLSEMRNYKVLRFMDWMETNRLFVVPDNEEGPLVVNFADYPTSDGRWSIPVPIDVMVNLCNTLNSDCYFNIPHTASDDFVRSFTEQVHSTLNPNLKFYVEYSNEVWNNGFDQHIWVARRGCELLSPDPDGECRVPGDAELCNPYNDWNDQLANCIITYLPQYFAQRTVEIMQIVENVVGPSYPDRVIRVMGAQVGSLHQGIGNVYLGNGNADYIDVVAVAPYFGGGNIGSFLGSVDAVFEQTTTVTQNCEFNPGGCDSVPAGTYTLLAEPGDYYGGPINYIRYDQFFLDNNYPDVSLMAYEGGQHLLVIEQEGVDVETQSDIIWTAQRDSRMKDMYLQFLNFWSEITGNSMFIHFTSAHAFDQYGMFGVKEYQGQSRSESPKEDALLTFIETNQNNPSVCGNSIVETGEQCDNGNLADGDGCSSTCQNEVTDPGSTVVIGDVSGEETGTTDGVIDEEDVNLIVSHIIRALTLTPSAQDAADTNCDDRIDIRDIIRILMNMNNQAALPESCPQA